MIKFRQNLSPASNSGGKIIRLILVGSIVLLGIFLLSRRFISIPSEYTLEVRQLNETQYCINGDTTFFDDFASSLIDSVRIAKQKYAYITIKAHSPRTATAAQIADFMSLVQALDDGKRVTIRW